MLGYETFRHANGLGNKKMGKTGEDRHIIIASDKTIFFFPHTKYSFAANLPAMKQGYWRAWHAYRCHSASSSEFSKRRHRHQTLQDAVIGQFSCLGCLMFQNLAFPSFGNQAVFISAERVQFSSVIEAKQGLGIGVLDGSILGGGGMA